MDQAQDQPQDQALTHGSTQGSTSGYASAQNHDNNAEGSRHRALKTVIVESAQLSATGHEQDACRRRGYRDGPTLRNKGAQDQDNEAIASPVEQRNKSARECM